MPLDVNQVMRILGKIYSTIIDAVNLYYPLVNNVGLCSVGIFKGKVQHRLILLIIVGHNRWPKQGQKSCAGG